MALFPSILPVLPCEKLEKTDFLDNAMVDEVKGELAFLPSFVGVLGPFQACDPGVPRNLHEIRTETFY
jgi:hypothetical protein